MGQPPSTIPSGTIDKHLGGYAVIFSELAQSNLAQMCVYVLSWLQGRATLCSASPEQQSSLSFTKPQCNCRKIAVGTTCGCRGQAEADTVITSEFNTEIGMEYWVSQIQETKEPVRLRIQVFGTHHLRVATNNTFVSFFLHSLTGEELLKCVLRQMNILELLRPITVL